MVLYNDRKHNSESHLCMWTTTWSPKAPVDKYNTEQPSQHVHKHARERMLKFFFVSFGK